MATAHKTGGEVDAFCSRCNLNLAHTILAMVGAKIARVKCNTCQNDHVYRGVQTAMQANSFTKPRKSAKALAAESGKVTIGFQERIGGKDPSKARKYSPKETFALDDLIDHPTFGLGIVAEVRADKIVIHFKADEKTLIHGRGDSAPAAKPTFASLHGGTAAKPIEDAPAGGDDASPPPSSPTPGQA